MYGFVRQTKVRLVAAVVLPFTWKMRTNFAMHTNIFSAAVATRAVVATQHPWCLPGSWLTDSVDSFGHCLERLVHVITSHRRCLDQLQLILDRQFLLSGHASERSDIYTRHETRHVRRTGCRERLSTRTNLCIVVVDLALCFLVHVCLVTH